ncbi:MAG: flagellar export protein FliJ [Rhodocyclaceae bacterium]|nr:flagellar export protein FliJ [Rhodocyclaceae bacterium]
MGKTFPLQTLLDLSQLRLDEATRRLGELISGEQEASQRLELLTQYRQEYQSRFVAAAQSGLSREAWANYQSFLAKLDAAVAQAGELVNASRQRTAEGQQEWLAKRGKLKAFDTLAQRHETRFQYAEGKKEQKDQDEHASRRHGNEDK